MLKNKTTLFVAGRMGFSFLLMLLMLVLFDYAYTNYRLPSGLYLGGHYLGGKPYGGLTPLLDELAEELEGMEVIFVHPYQEARIVYQATDLDISLDRKQTLAGLRGAVKPFRFWQRYDLRQSGMIVPPRYTLDRLALKKVFGELEANFNREMLEAKVQAEGGELRYIAHRHGVRLDREGLTARMLESLEGGLHSSVVLELPLIKVKADTTVSSILDSGIRDELYTATTRFDPGNEDRVHNIRLAAGKINNIMLKPGETFSFNKIVGEASRERGYKEAPVIVNEKLVMGTGGGICQVSTTIYLGALMTGMTIRERHNHGLAVAYCPPGHDAAVNYDYLDLKFSNELPTQLLLHTRVTDDRLTVTFFGDAAVTDEIKLVEKDLVTIPPPEQYHVLEDKPSLYRETIQEGKPGFEVETLRVFYREGEEFLRENLGRDYYAPVPYIHEVGGKKSEDRSQDSA